ncbi:MULTISPECIES: SdrD B-like domain-containing protein [unclassified Anabaena]|uniref:SdrD B-like domain-containing protein n=1 Tax=unclassified Anabaena TaxID=2619674 RepID=UPI0014464A2D|nr:MULTISPECIES: SdrD B-like domain-containing protein [unclassified Anabaena]MTJ09229.1 DUF11 domain-containing protein [Anabaena sp. UHCC 0204]MTJ54015.1 DUF11 domain-containing protein [Anabaena sp. UHCC 0253]
MVTPGNAQQTTTQLRERTYNFINQAGYKYTFTDPDKPEDANTTVIESLSAENRLNSGLVDPLGRILGCDGRLLSDYTGFSVSIHEIANNNSVELGALVDLTSTEIPDLPGNGIPLGIRPNSNNINPFPVPNDPPDYAGSYNFLFDEGKGQINPGRTYILVINPSANSIYQQRRIKIRIEEIIGSGNNRQVRYTAVSLDGLPITLSGQEQIEATQVLVEDAERQGLILSALQLSTNLCQNNQIRITKSGDRATAAPGDTVIYRLSVKNSSDVAINNISVTDILPVGFRFLANVVKAEINGQPVNITTTNTGNIVNFNTNITMEVGQILNIAYAAQLTNDAQRGTGRNTASVQGQRDDRSNLILRDGPVSHLLKIVQGIVSDSGTIIGRVFVDKNFDGEQQDDEPGVPNAVVYLQDGNRITTDANGLFSVANVLPGHYAGVLDLTSLPGYTLAPNRKFNERNSQSRLVHLAPGGLVRMNFAVTPSFKEQVEK